MPIISRWPVEDEGVIYPAGEVISLSDEDEERLVKSGHAVYAEEEKEEDLLNEDPPLTDLLSIEDFKALAAPAQKEILISCELTPGSNTEERLQQYVEWYELQLEEDPDDTEL